MPVIGSDSEITNEYLGPNAQGRIYLGSQKIQNGLNPYLVVRGGTVTTDGDYKIHTFTTVGTSSLFIDELSELGYNDIEYLIVGGGGAGGLTSRAAEAGGAGGLLTGSYTPLFTGSNSIIVGAGGIGAINTAPNTKGSDSSAFEIIAFGGGKGSQANHPDVAGKNGGSGASNGGLGTAGQGNNGGPVPGSGQSGFSPGGGGAGQVGGAGSNQFPITAGAGGSGSLSSINGTALYYAGGGGGGGADGDVNNVNGGLGGVGGGGAGGAFSGTVAARSGKDATFYGSAGGGAGAFVDGVRGGNGYQGIVIIRYKYK
jgi:hypothetical protein